MERLERMSSAQLRGLWCTLLTIVAVQSTIAQTTLTGYWEPIYHEDYIDRVPGPAIGDYAGMPITDAARLRGDSWDASLLTVPEHQCMPHPSTYGFRGVGTLRIWETRNPETQQLIKLDTWISWQSQHREIWLDGRRPPPRNALHTWQGFSIGQLRDNALVVDTTHLKAGWARRNGLPLSDQATMREYFFRHDGTLTHVAIVTDPVYLSEPLVRSNGFRYATNGTTIPYPCRPAVEIARPRGAVPHHLPGQNPFLEEVTSHRIPAAAARGGAYTMMPEYLDGTRSSHHAATLSTARPATTDSQRSNSKRRPPPEPEPELAVLHIQAGLHLISGSGGNVVVQVGNQGVLLVDTGVSGTADQLVTIVKDLVGARKLRYIINTGSDADHVGGNEKLRKSGETILGGNVVMDDPRGQQGATVIAHENVQIRLISSTPPVSEELWPTETFSEDTYDFFFNDEALELIHPPVAHADGDLMVFFRKSDVLVAGDILAMTSYPVVDLDRGGSINGLIAALNTIIEIAVPRDKQEGGTLIVPGHGRLCDEADVVEYRDMVTIIRDRIQDLVEKGMTLQQVQEARPTADYDGRFGMNRSAFVEAVYRSLKQVPGRPSPPIPTAAN